jgi:hypothetical protein
MMARTQIMLEREMQRRARQRLVARDLGGERPAANPAVVVDLGASDGCDVAANKDAMLAEAFTSGGREPRRLSGQT